MSNCKHAGTENVGNDRGFTDDIEFAGTMHGSVFVGEEQPYESLPWYWKTPFTVIASIVVEVGSALLAAQVVCEGTVELVARGFTLPPNLWMWTLAFVLIWGVFSVLNSVGSARNGASRTGFFDLIVDAALPALGAGGFVSYSFYVMASPVSAVLAGVAVASITSLLFWGPIGNSPELRRGLAAGIGATAGTLLLLAFVMYTH